MYALFRVMPDADAVSALEPPELAFILLPLLKQAQTGSDRTFSPYNLENELRNHVQGASYPVEKREILGQALREAFAWLSAQGLIVPAPFDSQGNWSVLSRRAMQIADNANLAVYVAAQRLNKDLLHPAIADRVWAAFLRGEYDVAVFQSMKAVEVSVRRASGASDGDIGVALMRKAFHSTNGALTDFETEISEREARAALFVGAIGSYKNPQSHRDVNLENPDEAIEIILLANHLLRLVSALEGK